MTGETSGAKITAETDCQERAKKSLKMKFQVPTKQGLKKQLRATANKTAMGIKHIFHARPRRRRRSVAGENRNTVSNFLTLRATSWSWLRFVLVSDSLRV